MRAREHPPDPHRGYDIGASVVHVTLPAAVAPWPNPLLLTTSSHSVLLPTPDFSMMYNVITLTCTVLALCYGQVVNLLARRLGEVYRDGEFVSQRPLARVLRFVLGGQKDKAE